MSTAEFLGSARSARDDEEPKMDLLDVLLVLDQFRLRIAAVTIAALVLGILVALVIKPTFTASAIILPPQQGQSMASSLMGQLGPLAALGSGGGLIKSPADMYVGILGSRTIADQLIARFHLQSVKTKEKLEDTRTRLKSQTRILATKDGLIHISVEDPDPNRASELANSYVDALQGMNSTLAITEAAQRRVFFDEQLAEEKNALARAENDLKNTQERTGLFQLSGQAEAIIRSIAQMRAEISSREVQIQSLRTFATEQNPEAIRAEQEITSLRQQLANLENDPRNKQSDSIDLSARNVPQAGLDYARKLREVHYHESLFELLSKQYEAARFDEAKSAPIIQVVDRAIPPDKKSGPHRLYVVLGFGFVGFFGGCLSSFISQGLNRLRQVPEYASKLNRLQYLGRLGL